VDVKDILAPSRLSGLTHMEPSVTVSSDVIDPALVRSEEHGLRPKLPSNLMS
jgi:hypothetical protein